MARIKDDTGGLEKTLYAIETGIQKQITPLQKNIESLKKRSDKILSSAQKTFQENEKAYQNDLRLTQKDHAQTMEKTVKAHDEDIKKQETILEKAKKDVDRKIKSLSTDHEEKLKSLKTEIETIEKEKDRALAEIELKHQETTQVYGEKLKLYEDNLRQNREKYQKKLAKLIKKIRKAHAHEQKNLENLEDILDKDFDALETTFDEENQAIRDELGEENSAVEYEVNALRKSINTTIRELRAYLSKTGGELKKPFDAFNGILDDADRTVASFLETFLKDLEFDTRNETHRLKALLKPKGEESIDKKTHDDINRQIELNHMRKKALSDHANQIEKMTKDTSKMFKETAQRTFLTLKGEFDEHEKLLNNHQSKVKKKLDIFQTATPELFNKLGAFLDESHPKANFDALKALFKSLFKALHEFENERITHLINTTNTVQDYYDEMDEIRFFLDTKDARKEISTTKERIDAEQKDAALRYDMKLSQKRHEKKREEIDLDFLIQEHEALNSVEIEKELQTLNDLIATKKAVLETLETEFEKEKAAHLYVLRKNQAGTDKSQLETRRTIDLEILSNKKEINHMEAEKNYTMRKAELETQKENDAERLALGKMQEDHALKRIETQIRTKEDRIDKQYEESRENARDKYEEDKRDLEDAIAEEKKRHENNLKFIEQAYERESAKARATIEDVRSMVDARLNPVSQKHKDLLTRIHSYKETFKQTATSLKDTLKIVAPPFRSELIEHIHNTTRNLEEAYTFIKEIEDKQVDESETKEKKRNLEHQKIDTWYKESLKDLETQEETIIRDIETTLERPVETMRRNEAMQLRAVKALMRHCAERLETILNDYHKQTKETINSLFKPFVEHDEQLLEKAKHSLTLAKEEEKRRFKEVLAPLSENGAAILKDYEKAIDAIEEKAREEKETTMKDLYQLCKEKTDSLDRIKDRIANLDETYLDKKKTLHAETEAEKEDINNRNAQRKEAIENRYQAQMRKVDERLEDAHNLYDAARTNAESTLKDIEVTALELQQANADRYDHINTTKQASVDKLRDKKEKALSALNGTLNETLEKYEEQILTAKGRLESRIETGIRKINDQVRIKQARRTHLKEIIRDKEYGLYDKYKTAYDTLMHNVRTIMSESRIKDLSATRTPEKLFSPQDDIIKAYMENTIKNIQSTD